MPRGPAKRHCTQWAVGPAPRKVKVARPARSEKEQKHRDKMKKRLGRVMALKKSQNISLAEAWKRYKEQRGQRNEFRRSHKEAKANRRAARNLPFHGEAANVI